MFDKLIRGGGIIWCEHAYTWAYMRCVCHPRASRKASKTDHEIFVFGGQEDENESWG